MAHQLHPGVEPDEVGGGGVHHHCLHPDDHRDQQGRSLPAPSNSVRGSRGGLQGCLLDRAGQGRQGVKLLFSRPLPRLFKELKGGQAVLEERSGSTFILSSLKVLEDGTDIGREGVEAQRQKDASKGLPIAHLLGKGARASDMEVRRSTCQQGAEGIAYTSLRSGSRRIRYRPKYLPCYPIVTSSGICIDKFLSNMWECGGGEDKMKVVLNPNYFL